MNAESKPAACAGRFTQPTESAFGPLGSAQARPCSMSTVHSASTRVGATRDDGERSRRRFGLPQSLRNSLLRQRELRLHDDFGCCRTVEEEPAAARDRACGSCSADGLQHNFDVAVSSQSSQDIVASAFRALSNLIPMRCNALMEAVLTSGSGAVKVL